MGYFSNGVFPACAGMIRGKSFKVRAWPSVPRVRGDDPAYHLEDMRALVCSPRARG